MSLTEIVLAVFTLLATAIASILWWIVTGLVRKTNKDGETLAALREQHQALKDRMDKVDGIDIGARLAGIEATVHAIAADVASMRNRQQTLS